MIGPRSPCTSTGHQMTRRTRQPIRPRLRRQKRVGGLSAALSNSRTGWGSHVGDGARPGPDRLVEQPALGHYDRRTD